MWVVAVLLAVAALIIAIEKRQEKRFRNRTRKMPPGSWPQLSCPSAYNEESRDFTSPG
jgi:hypothetical protein